MKIVANAEIQGFVTGVLKLTADASADCIEVAKLTIHLENATVVSVNDFVTVRAHLTEGDDWIGNILTHISLPAAATPPAVHQGSARQPVQQSEQPIQRLVQHVPAATPAATPLPVAPAATPVAAAGVGSSRAARFKVGFGGGRGAGVAPGPVGAAQRPPFNPTEDELAKDVPF